MAGIKDESSPLFRLRDFMGDISRTAEGLAKALNTIAEAWRNLRGQTAAPINPQGGIGTAPYGPVRTRARGGDEWVTRPTLFLAGEGNRPERVTVTPQGKAGGGNNITFNITGRNAEEISRTVIRRLREVGL
jgi:hypothetical protein